MNVSIIIYLLFLIVICCSQARANEEIEFDSDFLFDNSQIDLKKFAKGNPINSGKKNIEVIVNSKPLGKFNVNIEANDNYQFSNICLDKDDLHRLNFKYNDKWIKNSKCINPVKINDLIKVEYQSSEQTVYISIPQVLLNKDTNNYIDSKEYDSGVTSAFIQYDYNNYRSKQNDNKSQTKSLGLNLGFNIDSWYFRYNSFFINSNYDAKKDKQYQVSSAYVETDVDKYRSKLIIGKYYSDSDIFDSIQFKGATFFSDELMLPLSERGFAPEIKGVANSNSLVTVYQKGNVLYQESVPPGPFIIDHLNDTGYGGDLTLVIEEADGTKKSRIIPYTSLEQLYRKGQNKYNVTIGVYSDQDVSEQNSSSKDNPFFMQGTYHQGLSDKLSGQIGFIFSDSYLAANLGASYDTGFGAISLDTTYSYTTDVNSSINNIDESIDGVSYRLAYRNQFDKTDTNLSIAAYQFSGENYLNFSDAVSLHSNPDTKISREKRGFEVTLSQNVFEAGDLYLSGLYTDTWDDDDIISYQLGYSHSLNWGSVNLYITKNIDDKSTSNYDGDSNTEYSANINIPLGKTRMSFNSSVTYDNDKNQMYQLGLNGVVGEESRFSYNTSLYKKETNESEYMTKSIMGQYQADKANLRASYTNSDNGDQFSYGIQGSFIASSDGVFVSSESVNTIAIVEAKDAEGGKLNLGNNKTIDRNGYAIISGLSAYERNSIEIDPTEIPETTEVLDFGQNIVPRKGAITKIKFDTKVGIPLLIKFHNKHGDDLPFGTEVIKNNELIGNIGQNSMFLIRESIGSVSYTLKYNKKVCNSNLNVKKKDNNEIIKVLCE
ncbi:TPA: fimbria/pilus outer membrane usher protein [Photobacterium damselae]